MLDYELTGLEGSPNQDLQALEKGEALPKRMNQEKDPGVKGVLIEKEAKVLKERKFEVQ